MKKIWKAARWFILASLILGAYAVYRIGWGTPFTINMLANRQAVLFLIRNPELFTQIGAVDGTIFDRHSGKLAAVGVAKRDQDYAFAEKLIGEVKEFDRTRLVRQDQITYDILLDFYGSMLQYKRFEWLSSEGLYPISPMFGTQITLPSFLQSSHVVKNEKTARNYVARLEAMGAKLDALTAEMQRQVKLGVMLPPSLLEKSLTVIADTVKAVPSENGLVSSFVEKMNKVSGLDTDLKAQLQSTATAAVKDRVYPAYARMTDALIALRSQTAAQGAGAARLPDGARYYQFMLKQMTTTDDPPEQVHQLGLNEVARIEAEMDALLKGQSMAVGTVAERMKKLREDPRFLLPSTDEGRAQMLTRYRQLLDEVNARMPEYFSTLPPEKLIVARVPIAAEKGSAGAYYNAAAMDGSRPGTFFANLRDLKEMPTWGMKTLAYHEGIPGHHFQIATAQGLKGLPLIRQQSIYTAYVEGWALYAERLGAEMGLYKDDPFGDLGRLQAEIFRAVRLVVDTGMHAKGWSREQAIAYMVNNTGMGESEVTTEIERYMALPGQACAYKLGQLKILALRDKAKTALGARFSLKDFHAVVLDSGAVPLTILEQLVDEWIAQAVITNKSAKPAKPTPT